MNNAVKICELFNIPKSYFLFNEDLNKLDISLREKICAYINEYVLHESVDKIIKNCKKKISDDQIEFKNEYLPIFDYDKKLFSHYGLFDNNISKLLSDETIIDNLNNYIYSSLKLAEYDLSDILFKYKGNEIELSDLINCNDLNIFRYVLEVTKSKKYVEKNYYNQFDANDFSTDHVQRELNKILENLNPNLSNFWKIIVFLIDNGAYYTKLVGTGNDVICWSVIKNISKTNLVYRIAKDNIKE